jgi:hypothetical protein
VANQNPDQKGANGATTPEGEGDATTAVEMVPKADVIRVQGEKGTLTRDLNEARRQVASLTDANKVLTDRRGPVEDDERSKFDNEFLALNERTRAQDERETALKGRERDATVREIVGKYPNVAEEELLAMQAEGVDGPDLRVWAVEKHYERRATKDAEAATTETVKKPVASTKTVDTNGGGQATTTTPTLTAQEKRQAGLTNRREENKDAYRTASAG